MTPSPFRLMVVKLATFSAFSTQPIHVGIVLHIHPNLCLDLIQFDSIHKPRRLNSQYLSIKFSVLHPVIVSLADVFRASLSSDSPSRLQWQSPERRIGQCWEATRAPTQGPRRRRGVFCHPVSPFPAQPPFWYQRVKSINENVPFLISFFSFHPLKSRNTQLRRGGCAINKMARSLLRWAQTGWFRFGTTPSRLIRRRRATPPNLRRGVSNAYLSIHSH